MTITIDSGAAQAALDKAYRELDDATPLMRIITGILEAETEANFAAQGRPSWVPLAASTKNARLKRNRGSTVLQILQDRGILAASVSGEFGSDFSMIGAGGAASPYAATHQYGGEITRSPYSSWVRLRTDDKGNLLRQSKNKNLAVFAKDSHKRATTKRYTSEGYTIRIPARPYLPFSGPPGGERLQPEAEQSILESVVRFMQDSFER